MLWLNIIILLIVVSVLIAAAGVGGYFIYKKYEGYIVSVPAYLKKRQNDMLEHPAGIEGFDPYVGPHPRLPAAGRKQYEKCRRNYYYYPSVLYNKWNFMKGDRFGHHPTAY